jgi:hypothetical protein
MAEQSWRTVRLTSAELARRLNLALDYHELRTGSRLTFPEISAYVETHGESMSRARWQHMLTGDRGSTRDPSLLTTLERLFGLETGYFTGELDRSTLVEAQAELINTLRAERVSVFAARTLNQPLSEEAIRAIHRIVESESQRQRPS